MVTYIRSLLFRAVVATVLGLVFIVPVVGWIPGVPVLPFFSVIPWWGHWTLATVLIALFMPADRRKMEDA